MSDQARPVLLIFSQWFTPARKAGGPIRSIENLAELLKDDLAIYIFTSDRDLGDVHPFTEIQVNAWIAGKAYHIFYADRTHQHPKVIRKIITELNPDTIYLNSMYAWKYSIRPLMTLRQMGYKGRIVLSPRGMLKATAMKFKSLKKKVFLLFLRQSPWLKKVFFHATDELESLDIQKWLHVTRDKIVIAHNVPFTTSSLIPVEKKRDHLSLIFLGRIHPIKGLDFALDILKHISGNVNFTVIGWIEDKSYYEKCLRIIKSLPDGVHVDILGDLSFDQVTEHVQKTHFLLLPTHGENFGHAIFECLSFGRPVIISNETPYKNLESKKCGWDLSLQHPAHFQAAIETALNMDQDEYNIWSQQAYRFAKNHIETASLKEEYLSLFAVNSKVNSLHVHTGH